MPTRPAFLLDLTFTDRAEWCLRLECCGRTVCLPFRFLAGQKPRGRLGGLILALRCRDCGQRPGRVVLVDDAADGAYGRLAPRGWRIDPNSVANPYGRYGSRYSPDSINNPYGPGSPYRPDSPNNPYGTGMGVYR